MSDTSQPASPASVKFKPVRDVRKLVRLAQLADRVPAADIVPQWNSASTRSTDEQSAAPETPSWPRAIAKVPEPSVAHLTPSYEHGCTFVAVPQLASRVLLPVRQTQEAGQLRLFRAICCSERCSAGLLHLPATLSELPKAARSPAREPARGVK